MLINRSRCDRRRVGAPRPRHEHARHRIVGPAGRGDVHRCWSAVRRTHSDGSCAYVYHLEPLAYSAQQGASCTTGVWRSFGYIDSVNTNSVLVSVRPSYLVGQLGGVEWLLIGPRRRRLRAPDSLRATGPPMTPQVGRKLRVPCDYAAGGRGALPFSLLVGRAAATPRAFR